MRDLFTALQAIVAGIAITVLLYFFLNKLIHQFSERVKRKVEPYIFIGPVLLLIGLFVIWPTLQSIRLSFMEEAIDGSTTWIGLQNYRDLVAEEYFADMIINNLMWIAIVPILTVALGLAIAQFANNVGPRQEKIFKSIFFMPMTISFVSAAVIWRYIYAYAPEGNSQIGILNAIWTALGGEPQTWFQIEAFKLNNILLMIILIWLSAGYAMVLLSAAIKSVPEDTLEAGRVDGASTSHIFFKIILPQIWPTAIAVFITVLIGAMKVFDIVLAMTGGNYNTTVLAQTFYLEYFIYGNTGKAMAAVVILILAIIPVMVYQVRHYRKFEAAR
jgi:alpha-glucoside transport system permease protein|uniref:carbohydrate ABC transporter permease n=1 Tax=Candidatus Planktophila sp. TaxID=2175601 RepID=UPI00404A5B1E